MSNRDLAEKIFEKLNEKGAGLGNASIIFIEGVLDEFRLNFNNLNDNKTPVARFFAAKDENPDLNWFDWSGANLIRKNK